MTDPVSAGQTAVHGPQNEASERKPVTSIDIDGTTVHPSPDGEWPEIHNGGPDDIVISGPGHRDTI